VRYFLLFFFRVAFLAIPLQISSMHLKTVPALVLCLAVPLVSLGQTNTDFITGDALQGAEDILGLDFSESHMEMLVPSLKEQLRRLDALRNIPLSNSVPPALLFDPIPTGVHLDTRRRKFKMSSPGKVTMPANREDLAFYSVGQLAALIRSRQLSSEALTRLYLERLKRYGPKLECVITLTEDVALEQARRADAEIAAGKYRGPLHGIPYGAKDLLATRGVRTTWGAAPYTNQLFETDATVIQRLTRAGAVLVAKTTLGELAMGEVWFGGKTRNPWNLTEGSSGSSAGSAAGTAAGLFAFAIGSETLGSIVSPCDRCGVTGLRPTFGRVSRAGAMTLSWSMDKLGPLCRSVEDCALVLEAIHGPDGIDPSVYDAPFNYDPKVELKKLRIGYVKADFERERNERKENDQAALDKMRSLGAELIPVELPNYPLNDILVVLSTEAAAAFDDLTRSKRDDWLKQQESGSWPNTFRQRRFVPAVEYIQAQRARYLLIQDSARLFDKVDLFLAPSLGGRTLLLSNLTGHPCVVVPDGFTKAGAPTSISFIGQLFGEGELLAVAKKYQDATEFNRRHPRLD
jgi:Asp-tRNA(Asn)/Glu-tRNA(Gln) amidotransferase A subunit family amidase